MSSPRLMRSASSALRATVTVTPTSTSGCTAMAILCLPMVLIGASSITWLRLMATPSFSNDVMMSRTDTEPNSCPVSDAWRNTTTLRPSIFSATLVASPLACRLRASRSAFMPSNLARLSVVARNALPRFSRKLRANPSLTRTTSPIWPSLATRSSKMTSIFVLLCGDGFWLVERGSSGRGKGRWPSPQIALTKPENGIGEAKSRHPHNRPDEQHDGDIDAAKPERAALQCQRQCVQHGEPGERVSHHQHCGDDLCQDRHQSAGEAECEGGTQCRECQRRQCRHFQVRPWTL